MAKEREQKKGKASEQQERSAEAPRHSAKERPRLRTRFEKEIAPALLKELELKNMNAVPRLNKIVVNMGVGEATQNAKILDPAAQSLQDLRTSARVPAQVRHLPSVLPLAGAEGRDSWSFEVVLVEASLVEV